MPGIPATVLTNVNISDTFYGVLHAGGQPIAATGQAQIYDGNGGITSLKLGIDCNGATICGGLSAATLSATNLSLSTPILSTILPDVTPTPVGTYTGYLTSISVTSKGIVTSVSTTSTVPQPYKAYASISFNGSYNSSANQGSSPTNFTITGNNIAQITWQSTGFYRVTFTTPMANTNYHVFMQACNFVTGAGTAPTDAQSAGPENLIITHRNVNFFEFINQVPNSNFYVNIRACALLII